MTLNNFGHFYTQSAIFRCLNAVERTLVISWGRLQFRELRWWSRWWSRFGQDTEPLVALDGRWAVWTRVAYKCRSSKICTFNTLSGIICGQSDFWNLRILMLLRFCSCLFTRLVIREWNSYSVRLRLAEKVKSSASWLTIINADIACCPHCVRTESLETPSNSVLRREQRIRSLSSYQVSRRVNFELMIKSKQ